MSNIRWFEGQVDVFWNKVKNDYAGFDKPQIVPAATVRGNAPMYMRRYIDQDPTSFYMFMAGDPLRHQDISRDKACEFFDKLFYEHLGMPSSYDIDAGGNYSREQAIDKEVLPAKDDSAFRTYYEEQMDIINQMATDGAPVENPAQDDDVIDVELGSDGKYAAAGSPSASRAVGSASSTAVGMPKKIWYGVDFHIPAGGGMLGTGGSGSLGHRARRHGGYLHEDDVKDEMMQEALIGRTAGMISQYILDAIGLAGCKEGVGLALANVYEEFFGPLPANVCEEDTSEYKHVEGIGNAIDALKKVKTVNETVLTQDDRDDIAAMFAGYGSINTNDTRECEQWSEDINDFMQDHAAELKELVYQFSLAGQIGDFSHARELRNEDDLLKGRKHNAHVDEDDIEFVGEDEDTLDEALVRHSNWLAKEIW